MLRAAMFVRSSPYDRQLNGAYGPFQPLHHLHLMIPQGAVVALAEQAVAVHYIVVQAAVVYVEVAVPVAAGNIVVEQAGFAERAFVAQVVAVQLVAAAHVAEQAEPVVAALLAEQVVASAQV